MKVPRTARDQLRDYYDWLKSWSDEQFYFALLVGLVTILTCFVMFLDLVMQANFQAIECDTAAFQNAIVNTLNGHPFRDSAYDGPNILGLHSLYVILLIAPLYAIFPYTNMLFGLQVIIIYSAFIPIYLIALRLKIIPSQAFIITCSMFTNVTLMQMAVAPLHAETCILTCALWSYYFFLKRSLMGSLGPMFLAFICGEQSALIFISLGLFIWVTESDIKSRFFVSSMVGGGLIWLVIALGIDPLFFRSAGQTNLFALNYGDWKVNSPWQLGFAILGNPIKALEQFLDPWKWGYVVLLSGLPFLLALSNWRTYFLLLPIPLYLLMVNLQFYLDIHAYYFQFAVFASVLALIRFFTVVEMPSRLGIVTIFLTVASNIVSASMFYSIITFAMHFNSPDSADLLDQFAKIPTYEGVFCQHRYSAYLSNRPNMVMGDLQDKNIDIDALIEKRSPLTDVHPDQIDYIVCDLLTSQGGGRPRADSEENADNRMNNLNAYIKSGKWKVEWSQDNIYILKRTTAP